MILESNSLIRFKINNQRKNIWSKINRLHRLNLSNDWIRKELKAKPWPKENEKGAKSYRRRLKRRQKLVPAGPVDATLAGPLVVVVVGMVAGSRRRAVPASTRGARQPRRAGQAVLRRRGRSRGTVGVPVVVAGVVRVHGQRSRRRRRQGRAEHPAGLARVVGAHRWRCSSCDTSNRSRIWTESSTTTKKINKK